MKIGVVIPWREQPSRIKPFKEVLKWYEENLPEAKVYLADRPGPVWHPSGTRNDGVRMAESDGCDVIVMNDADTIPEIKSLRQAIGQASVDNLIHTGYNQFKLLEDKGTEQYFDGNRIELCSGSYYNQACFGINIFTPAAWWAVGGMDEKFKGWGYEDTSMQTAHRVIHGKYFVRHNGTGYGLGHAKQSKTDVNFNNNKTLYEEYTKIKTKDDMLALVAREELFKKLPWTKLKVLAFVDLYPPMNNAGGEMMLHQMLVDLKKRGHDVRVVCTAPTVRNIDEIDLYDIATNLAEHIAWSDLVITQLGYTKKAMKAVTGRKPLVHIVHNDTSLKIYGVNEASAQLIVANSSWIRETVKVKTPTIIVYPPTNPNDYAVKTSGEAITLINLCKEKGGEMFWQLARIFPDKKFIGVKGGYGKQIVSDINLPNVTIYENTPDILEVYKQTRIAIMPSDYESWGRVGMEVAASGIPTIATPTPGLKESLGNSGIFVEYGDVAGYVEAIRMLDDKHEYRKHSEAAKARSSEMSKDLAFQLDMFENSLIKLKR